MSACLIATVFAASCAATSPETLKSSSLSVGIRNGVVMSFSDLRTKETYVFETPPSLTGLRRLKDRHLWNDKADVTTRRNGNGLTVEATWREDEEPSRVVTRLTPQANGDVLVTQEARSVRPGVVGVQWGWVVPETWEVLVPGHSGLRFGADTPSGRHQFAYPRSWEAQFVLLQGKRGGVLIYAEDDCGRFKALHLDRQQGQFHIGLETQCTAPLEPIRETTSVRWRVHAYQGHWLVGAGAYRAWATRTFGLTPLIDHRPTWVKDVQFVVIAGLDEALLKALARHVEPRQTLVYVPGWRRDGYDRNYPAYTPVDGLTERMKRARALGFRVMLHVNYFGVTPENPHYAALKPYHCVDPVTHRHVYWDWQRAKPPIKFAYINPAAKAWRELFVRLMVKLCETLAPDALHLDQTLCIFNDAHGLIDGMNMMQGNVALHRALREALPNVALSGEGLNEITCRHEAFAQRHVYGISHVDQEWNDTRIAQAHPVSSALMAPYTTIYGYLGMAGPQPEDYYFAWRKAYERFAVIPTFARPSVQLLSQPPPVVRVLLNEARWFQQHRPVPDLASAWRPETLFAYRTSDGHRAAYRGDAHGVALMVTKPASKEISRRLRGATSVSLPGSIPDWRAYDGERLLGLDPAQSYVYLDEPRDLSVFHVHALPATTRVRRISLRRQFGTVCLADSRAVVADLWRFDGPTRCGERLRDGTTRTTNGNSYASETGTGVHPQGEGIFAHPPWRAERVNARGVTEATGLGTAWIEFDVRLPADKPARFESRVGLRTKHASDNSDGVTFRVTVRDRQGISAPLTATRHTKAYVPEPVHMDLSALRGKPVTVRLETDPGPTGSVTFDWALWTHPRIVLTEPHTVPIEVVSPRPLLGVMAEGGLSKPVRAASGRYGLNVTAPGTTYLLFETPRTVNPPVDLATLPFSCGLVQRDGSEIRPHSFMQAHVATTTVGGVSKQGLFAHPPSQGQMHIDLLLQLPNAPVRLTGFAGIRDGAAGKSQGVGFRIAVNGRELWRRDVQADGKWTRFDVSLSRHSGQAVMLSLITDALDDYICDWAHWGKPRLVPGT